MNYGQIINIMIAFFVGWFFNWLFDNLQPRKLQNPIKWLLGYLLHLANRNPPILNKDGFYEMKTEILKRYGKPVGYDVQRITKTCYNCNGSGIHSGWRGPERCFRCHGGVYQDSYIRLDRYDLGGFTFHHPVERFEIGNARNPYKGRETITGYVEHKSPKYYLAREAALWLFLIFRPQAFDQMFGNCGFPSKKFTPMVIACTLLYDFRSFANRINAWDTGKAHYFSDKKNRLQPNQAMMIMLIDEGLHEKRIDKLYNTGWPAFDLPVEYDDDCPF